MAKYQRIRVGGKTIYYGSPLGALDSKLEGDGHLGGEDDRDEDGGEFGKWGEDDEQELAEHLEAAADGLRRRAKAHDAKRAKDKRRARDADPAEHLHDFDPDKEGEEAYARARDRKPAVDSRLGMDAARTRAALAAARRSELFAEFDREFLGRPS